jgi:hypothetical protein
MLQLALTSLLFVVFYLGVALPVSTGFFIPQVALVPLAAIMAFRRPNFVTVGCIMAISVVAVGSVIALSTSHSGDPSMRRWLSGGQLVYILTVASLIATARPLSKIQADGMARLCNVLATAMLLFGLLEIFTPLRSVSDAFREAVFNDVYADDLRDLGMAGFVRPKAFASEPSLAAWGIAMLVFTSAALLPVKRNFVYGVALLLATGAVFYSSMAPAAAVALCLTAAILFWDRKRVLSSIAGVGVIGLAGVGLGLLLLVTFIGGRIDQYAGYEESLFIRVIQPFSLAKSALQYDWRIGVGFGGLEAIWNKIELIENGITVENLNHTPGMALLTIPLFSGVIGSALFIGLIAGILIRYRGRVGAAIVGILIFTLLPKQSFVISTAWIIAAIWAMQLKASLFNAGANARVLPTQGPRPWTTRAGIEKHEPTREKPTEIRRPAALI